jgi:hypothetical protein
MLISACVSLFPRRCWHSNEAKRPTMEDVIAALDTLKAGAQDGSSMNV